MSANSNKEEGPQGSVSHVINSVLQVALPVTQLSPFFHSTGQNDQAIHDRLLLRVTPGLRSSPQSLRENPEKISVLESYGFCRTLRCMEVRGKDDRESPAEPQGPAPASSAKDCLSGAREPVSGLGEMEVQS